MHFIKHAAKKVTDNIQQGIATLAHNDKLQDEALANHKYNLDRLTEMVSATKKSCSSYASAVTSMSGVAITMSSDIGQFYKTSDSMARSTFVGRFSDSAMRVDSLAIDVFRERFGWEILKRFDDWEEKIRKVDRQIQATEKNRVQVQNLHAQVSSLKGAKERRQQQGKELNEKEQQQYDEAEQKLEKYSRTLSKNRKQLDIDVGELMNDRFRELDSLLAKVVECQLEFFKNVAAAQTETLSAPLSAFKREFCSSEASAPALAAVKKTSPPSSDSEADNPHEESDSEDETPLATAKEPERKQESNGDAFQTKVTPPSTTNVSPVKRQGTHDDLLDMFGPSSQAKSTETKSKPAAAKAPANDDFLFFESSSTKPPASPSTRSASPAPPRSPVAGGKPATTPKPAPSSFDHFDPFGSSQSAPAAKPASRSSSPSPYSSSSTRNAKPATTTSQSQFSASAVDPFSSLNDVTASSAVDDYHQQERVRAADLAERDQARPKAEGKLAAWEFKSGSTKNNLRTLLATLHTILPDGPQNRWKKLSLTDLLDVPQMKKGYRTAMLATHPDKWQNAPADHKVIVQRCFEVLNDSWSAYQKEHGL